MPELTHLQQVSRKNLNGCHPELTRRSLEMVAACYRRGLHFAAFMGLRTWEQQAALYAQGRRPLDEVNVLRAVAGWGPIQPNENKRKVTNARAGQSWHNFGLAADLVEDGDPRRVGVQWSWASLVGYKKMGAMASDFGLESGSLWKSFKDYPHVQYRNGLALSAAAELYKKGGLSSVWGMVNKLGCRT